MTIYDEIRAERARAHEKHRETSMEEASLLAPKRFYVLSEELGEVAKEFNDADDQGREVDLLKLRAELIQVAAMATAWADKIDVPGDPEQEVKDVRRIATLGNDIFDTPGGKSYMKHLMSINGLHPETIKAVTKAAGPGEQHRIGCVFNNEPHWHKFDKN